MRLAIVGSRQFQHDWASYLWADCYIQWIIEKYAPEVVISGGATGIDSIAARIARQLGYEVIEHLPATKNWAGYKARNKVIAEDCTHLLAIIHSSSTSHGSGWTADYAESIGRKVYRKYYG